jgi:trimeric autotransporter adhesin
VEALMSLAAERDARAIVVGTYGEHPMKGAVLGSTPHKLLGADRQTALPNFSSPIRLDGTAHDNVIGGLAKGTGNLISANFGGGVSIGGATAAANPILGNSAFGNGEEVIDLAEEGVTPNDAGDGDLGPNRLQNFPVLSGANQQQDVIDGELDSTPATRFRIEFFTSPDQDDARRFVGAKAVTTDGAGHANLHFASPRNLPAGHFVTATATVLVGSDPGDTSELSDEADISVGP